MHCRKPGDTRCRNEQVPTSHWLCEMHRAPTGLNCGRCHCSFGPLRTLLFSALQPKGTRTRAIVQTPPSGNFLVLTSTGYSEALFYIFRKRSLSSWEGGKGGLTVLLLPVGIMWQGGTQVAGAPGPPISPEVLFGAICIFNRQFPVCQYIHLGAKAYSLF